MMGRKMVDLTGQRFGKLTVVRLEPTRKPTSWVCKCDCGNEKIVTSGHLKFGTVSCGCHRREVLAKLGRQNQWDASTFYKHGMSGARLYRIWCDMKMRCYYTKNDNYHNYGGRGIAVCDEWRNNSANFFEWAMANGYTDELTIDRIDSNGNYEPSNCRWATMKEQQNNRRNNRKVKHNGRNDV